MKLFLSFLPALCLVSGCASDEHLKEKTPIQIFLTVTNNVPPSTVVVQPPPEEPKKEPRKKVREKVKKDECPEPRRERAEPQAAPTGFQHTITIYICGRCQEKYEPCEHRRCPKCHSCKRHEKPRVQYYEVTPQEIPVRQVYVERQIVREYIPPQIIVGPPILYQQQPIVVGGGYRHDLYRGPTYTTSQPFIY